MTLNVALVLAGIAVAYLYAAAVCWRVGHPRKHGHVVWSSPRPARLLARGAHTKPRKPAPAEPDTAEPAGLVVAA